MLFNKSNRLNRLGVQLGIFCFFFAVGCANYHFYLTNSFTPGGDGGRIGLYLKYMEKVPEVIPLWQAHKHHGYPLMADPENFMPFNLLLNTESTCFNLKLNLIFFSLTALFAHFCYNIARILGISQPASIAVGLTTIVCVPTARVFMHGSLNAFVYMVLIYGTIFVLLWIMNQSRCKYVHFILLVPLMLAWIIQTGYYYPIIFHIPAFVFLMCTYLKQKETCMNAVANSSILLLLITVFMVLFSMPFLLPILDGIVVSNTFSLETSKINISDRDIYNCYLNLWPFILLALIFSRGLFRRYAFLFLAMAGINYLLILFNAIQFNAFFDIWTSTPILKNIRWQHCFRELSSIAAAFCAGVFIDAYRENSRKKQQRIEFALSFGLVILLGYIAFEQHARELPMFMVGITIVFILMVFFRKNTNAITVFFLIIITLMIWNFNQSPVGTRLYTTTNKLSYIDYDSKYLWWDSYGYDKYTPVLRSGAFSMVFMHEYRLLLSLLYEQEINAQRPHWIGRMDGVKRNNQNDKIAQLMAIKRPRTTSEQHDPFRVYDNWIVADEAKAIEIMKKEVFSPEGPIILAESPDFFLDADVVLQASTELTGKTADTITLHVKTNKNSIVLVPEIYHRDWKATVNGKKTPIIKAYASMRAVALPPGEHTIAMRFVYRPFYWGLIIASASLLLAFIFICFYKEKLQSFLSADENINTNNQNPSS